MAKEILYDVSKPFIGVAGPIGAGKTRITQKLSEILHIPAYYEPVIDNELLRLFYDDMKKHALHLQFRLLANRFIQQQQIVWSNTGGISDRTIYEDVIFARSLTKMGFISDMEFATYTDMCRIMFRFMQRPTLIVYLDVSPDESFRRIERRSRDMERGKVSLEYLTMLKREYDAFIEDILRTTTVLRVDWDTSLTDDEYDHMVAMVAEKISKYWS